jgi:hypothetical protein
LLSQLSLPDRLLESEPLSGNAQIFLIGFAESARHILESDQWANIGSSHSSSCDVADLLDGHLFSVCLQDSQLGISDHYQQLVSVAEHLGGKKVKPATTSANGSLSSNSGTAIREASEASSKPYAVLPFSNSVFEKHLAPIQLVVDKSDEITDVTSARIFREVTHWHNSKRPMDPKLREDQVVRSKKQQFFALRRNQWFMAEMMAYAASLTNAVGKVLEPETITTGAKPKPSAVTAEKKEESAKTKPVIKGGKKAPVNKKQAMLAEIAASKSRKDDASAEKLIQGWRLTCRALDQEPSLVARYQKTKQFQTTLNTSLKREALEAEVQLYSLNILVFMWIEYCRDNKKSEGLHLAALISDAVNALSKRQQGMTKTISSSLETTIKLLGLPKVVVSQPEGDRALTFNFALKPAPTTDLSIPLSANEFQLLHCGPYFERSIDSAPDPRTPFEPDAWQRKVLDEIDAKRSLLVVAPTSAGKTFISFYAMKQVLESSEDDILVYVAPTKALVNQIAAEVQARFSKSYKYAGNSVWGIHTRDYRINNPTGCQILVTVPHILQIMLLAPSNAKSWSERVKWIVFDEVHCIGQADDGIIWEQLLLLAPCPIIALSATIGNPDEFSDWLTSTQRAIGNDLTMVQHPHRYSDLRKFVYSPPASFNFEGLSDHRAFGQLGLDNCDDFTFIHPVASLVNRSRGMPDDFSLEARDCLLLWQSMNKHQTSNYPVPKELDPTIALPAVVRKIDIINWEAPMKTLLRSWMADDQSPFHAVFKELNRTVAAFEKNRLNALTKENDETYEPQEDDADANIESILPLLSSLHEQDALPGIVFNYDRGLCEKTCQSLLAQLEAAESSWKETNPKWKATLQSWEAWKKAMAKADKRRPPKVSNKKSGGGDEEVLSKADLMRDAASTEASPWASFDPDNPVDGFHFADNKKLTRDDLYKNMKELIRRDLPEWQLNGLRRGIGVHHAGMNRKYRQVVEMLFRKGFLRVIIATGTLALGINM